MPADASWPRMVSGVRLGDEPSSAASGETWTMVWQWNSQLPARSGVHVIAIVAPGGNSWVTTCCRSSGAKALSRMPSPRLSTSK